MNNILVTGAKGFIGKNLVATLNQNEKYNVIEIDRDNSKEELNKAVLEADFIYHLAGINRPETEEEFFEGNSGLTGEIVNILKENHKNMPIVITSSTHAELDNAYGRSKKLSEEALLEYSINTKANVFIYRFPNVLGNGVDQIITQQLLHFAIILLVVKKFGLMIEI